MQIRGHFKNGEAKVFWQNDFKEFRKLPFLGLYTVIFVL